MYRHIYLHICICIYMYMYIKPRIYCYCNGILNGLSNSRIIISRFNSYSKTKNINAGRVLTYRKSVNNSSNIINIVTHKLLHFYPFSWCFAHPSTIPLGPKLGDFMLVLVMSGDVSAS